jgi:hypothetical protein
LAVGTPAEVGNSPTEGMSSCRIARRGDGSSKRARSKGRRVEGDAGTLGSLVRTANHDGGRLSGERRAARAGALSFSMLSFQGYVPRTEDECIQLRKLRIFCKVSISYVFK